ncbi:pilus assembly protein [Roseomonas frigidaquae]|uniref:Pilus assembly protein n=1 Tax=Falsiroseomonas frigidaquae TaxID=487318 RepID=A0ABX1F086_9PROT|nr:TadE family protein [Falsiroseomonas frigidaquae]NKE45752.1 pilus assembly protein [Falsiroseomonas frigidaquae]
MRQHLARFLVDRRGMAAAEFALVGSVLVLLFLSMFDLSHAMWRTTRLEMAARAGAQYAFAKPQDSNGIATRVTAQLSGWTGVVVGSTAMVCRCDDGAAADCATGTCENNGQTHAPIGSLSITVTQPFDFISPLTALLFPQLGTLRGNVELRLH